MRQVSSDGATGCALAHTRLAILDTSGAAAQPMSTVDGRFTIVLNGAVYNFEEIRRELAGAGQRFRSTGDTEVVLGAFVRWGAGCLSRLRGMFALAVWDRDEGTLLLARDRLGIKPLYYRISSAGIAFASEVRAMLRTGLAEARLSDEGLRSYLAFGSVAEPRTMLQGVVAVPPASSLLFRRGGLSAQAYWRLPGAVAGARDLGEAADAMEPVLRDAVRLHLLSDVPLGIFLSGGVDSSALVSVAATLGGDALRTFAITFDEEAFNEERQAASVAARFGCRHQQVRLTGGEVAADVVAAWRSADQPTADGLNTFFLARAARQAGLRVALSGLGGDEVFAGYPFFRSFWAYRALGRAAAVGGRAWPGWARLAAMPGRPNRLQKLVALAAAGGERVGTYQALRRMFVEPQIAQLMAPASGRASDAAPSELAGRAGDTVGVLSELEIAGYLRNTLLRDTDAMSMAHGLEVRVPLLDDRVVETACAVPGRFKVGGRLNKPLLVAAAPHLPEEIARRSKMGFVLPLRRWFRGPIAGCLAEVFRSDDIASDVLRPEAVRSVLDAFERGERYVSASRISCLASLLVWCREHRVGVADRVSVAS